jgi:hypothetical protein
VTLIEELYEELFADCDHRASGEILSRLAKVLVAHTVRDGALRITARRARHVVRISAYAEAANDGDERELQEELKQAGIDRAIDRLGGSILVQGSGRGITVGIRLRAARDRGDVKRTNRQRGFS